MTLGSPRPMPRFQRPGPTLSLAVPSAHGVSCLVSIDQALYTERGVELSST